MIEKPRYRHDCKECQFVGHINHYDGYVCERRGNSSTVVLRFGSEGLCYMSMPTSMAHGEYAKVLDLKLTLEGKQP